MARRGCLPARANSFSFKGGRDYDTTAPTPSGDDVDASCGPSTVLRTVWTRPGQVLRTWPPLPHTRRSRAHILTASATTIHDKGDGTGSSRLPDCSVFPVNPATEHCDQLPWGPHDRFRETTGSHREQRTPFLRRSRRQKASGAVSGTGDWRKAGCADPLGLDADELCGVWRTGRAAEDRSGRSRIGDRTGVWRAPADVGKRPVRGFDAWGIDPAAVLAELTDGPAEQVYDRVGARRHSVKESSAARVISPASGQAGISTSGDQVAGPGETTGGNAGCPTNCS